ncbi:hypothetical protein Q3A91_01595 [Nocardia mangyaensis]|nr:hypothetical protein [Nocardia mangyaensis]MDO3645652.1 hypothetical protein [Nocardia mangyaensis]
MTPNIVGPSPVQIPRIGQKVESALKDLYAHCEFSTRRSETCLDAGSVGVDPAEAFFDLALRQCAIGGEVEEPLFLGVEVLELLGHAAVHLADAGLFVGQDLAQEFVHRGSELFRNSKRAVVLGDGFFDPICWEVGQVTYPFLAPSAQEVAVSASVASSGFGVDEARGSAVFMAATTEQVPLEVVLQHSVPLSAAASHVANILNSVEQFLRDDRLVPTGIQLSIDGDPTGVVRVLEHPVQQFERHRSFGDVSPCAGSQPEICHRGFEPLQAVLAGGIQLEGHADQRCAVRVDRDRVDLFAFVVHACVDVADPGDAQGSAVECLGAHLLLDVQALQRVHQVVHHVEHALHRHGMRSLAEVLLGADEADTHLVELGFDDGGVEPVAKCAGAHVDDDVAHLGVLSQVLEQIPEHRPLVDGLGRVTRFDELGRDLDAHRGGLCLAVVALGGDGQPIRVDVDRGVELLLGRDS